MTTTRMNPTTYGRPTLGHAYMSLLNRALGDTFLLRCTNNQADWFDKFTIAQMTEIADEWLWDFEWLGIKVDRFLLDSDTDDECEYAIRHLLPWAENKRLYDVPINFINSNYIDYPYPYAPWLIAECVWQDHRTGIDLLVCGDDLVNRFSAYRMIEQMFGYAHIPYFCKPRLHDEDGNISKRYGKWKLHEMRDAGWTAEQVQCLLRRSCLVDPAAGWSLENVKPHPLLDFSGGECDGKTA